MAIVSVDFFSASLGYQTTFQAILPDGRSDETRVLYLLHGLMGNDRQWIQRSAIVRYVDGRNLAVIMPNTHRGYYTDMKFGPKYRTFLTEDLPAAVKTYFALDPDRGHTFVGGLSMGGYGALKWGLQKPEKFSKVFALSPAVNISRMRHESKEKEQEFQLIFGSESEFEGSENDLYHLIRAGKPDAVQGTSFLQICGTEDPFYQDNLDLQKRFEQQGLEYTFRDRPGGHSWELWDEEIVNALNWLDK